MYAKLGADRQAVFDSIVRALFVPIIDKATDKPTGKRPIDFVTEVRGLWGWRKGVTNGRHVFRASVRVDKGLDAALRASSNLPKKSFGHVLRPVIDGGDDDPALKDFKAILVTKTIVTFREPGTIGGWFGTAVPSTQVSIITTDPEVAEVDIDFDSDDCHNKPSNSDVDSSDKQSAPDNHLAMLNAELAAFAVPMKTSWSKPESHCEESYQ